MRALCIIPEGRVTKDSKDIGYPYEVSDIKYLEEILKYAKYNDLGVLYLTTENGIVYSDDKVNKTKKSLNSYSKDDFERWSQIIAEEIIRQCISRSTSKVYIMNTSRLLYKRLISILEIRGVEVVTPIMGCTANIIRSRLLL